MTATTTERASEERRAARPPGRSWRPSRWWLAPRGRRVAVVVDVVVVSPGGSLLASGIGEPDDSRFNARRGATSHCQRGGGGGAAAAVAMHGDAKLGSRVPMGFMGVDAKTTKGARCFSWAVRGENLRDVRLLCTSFGQCCLFIFFENARKTQRTVRFVLFEKTRETGGGDGAPRNLLLEAEGRKEPTTSQYSSSAALASSIGTAHERPALLRHLRRRISSSRTERSLKRG